MGILMLIGICVRICYSNVDYRFMLVFPRSSEEDITPVSVVGCARFLFFVSDLYNELTTTVSFFCASSLNLKRMGRS
jgi:hypothetical protein